MCKHRRSLKCVATCWRQRGGRLDGRLKAESIPHTFICARLFHILTHIPTQTTIHYNPHKGKGVVRRSIEAAPGVELRNDGVGRVRRLAPSSFFSSIRRASKQAGHVPPSTRLLLWLEGGCH